MKEEIARKVIDLVERGCTVAVFRSRGKYRVTKQGTEGWADAMDKHLSKLIGVYNSKATYQWVLDDL